MSREAKILTGILLVVVALMVGIFALTNGGEVAQTPAVDSSKLVAADSHKTGTGNVTVVEFGDYQCPACGAAYPTTKKLLDEYNGKITFVFRNYPLTMHANAPEAAEAAEAAAAQGKFWEM